MNGDPREQLLDNVIRFVVSEGVAGKSLREIAAGAGTSHRMLIYHFGSHAGLLAAIVSDMERRQRELLTALAADARSPRELMTALWAALSGPRLRPFVRLFFEVVGLAAAGEAERPGLLADLTGPWLAAAAEAAEAVGREADPALLRAGVALTRGLLLDLVAGADPAEVDAAHAAYVDLLESRR